MKCKNCNDENTCIRKGFSKDVQRWYCKICKCYQQQSYTYTGKWDTHVYLSDKPITNATTISDCVVIEITPYTRTLHPEWTTDYVNKHLKGKKVTVEGWLLFDFKHTGVSFDSKPTAKKLERHTVWEIHPITNIVVSR